MSILDKTRLELDLYGITLREALDKNICIRCKRRPSFYSHMGKAEYFISGLCEPCFDEITILENKIDAEG
jgi:hypothetical protein